MAEPRMITAPMVTAETSEWCWGHERRLRLAWLGLAAALGLVAYLLRDVVPPGGRAGGGGVANLSAVQRDCTRWCVCTYANVARLHFSVGVVR